MALAPVAVVSVSGSRRFRAPGRVNLIGEHTDYSDGLVLPAAIDRALTLTVEPADDVIVLSSERAETTIELPADGSRAPEEGWGRYVAAMATELHRLGRPAVGMRGELASDLPQGAGLSSSAALEMVVGTALCALADFTLEPLELAAAGQRAEHAAVDVPVGIMDQAASVLGRRDHAVLLDCGTLAYEHLPLPSSLALVVLDSNVSRTLEGSGYGKRRAELERGLEVLDGRRPAEIDPEELDGLSAPLDEMAVRRLRHVVTENARVRATRTVLERPEGPDLDELARLFAASHASLRDDFEVTVAETDRLVELALDAGAVAARMTGGGFGGAIIALAPVDFAERIAADVIDRYDRELGQDGEALVCRAADGAGEVT